MKLLRRITAFAPVLLVTGIFVISITGMTYENLKEDWSSLRTGREVFQAACVTCHGSRGTGTDRSLLGFEDVEPPDFTDCKFTSREARNDWVGVAHSGGPVKGFSPMMPAFGKSLSMQQLENVVVYLKAFCPEKKWPPGEFNLPKALNTGKAFPEDEAVFAFSTTFTGPMSVKGKLAVAARLGARHQIEGVIPFEVKEVEYEESDEQTKYRWGEGAGDMALAWKSVLWFSNAARNIGSLTFDLILPTGDEYDQIGYGVFAFKPAMAFAQIIPYVGFLQLQGGAELSADPDRRAHNIFWRGVFGRTFRKGGFGRAFSPMLEFTGSIKPQVDDTPDWELVPQFQLALSKRQHIRFAAGLAIPINDYSERQMKFMAYLVWDWYDGGLTEGWR